MIHFGTQVELQSDCRVGQIVRSFFLRDVFSSRKKRRCFFRDMLRHGQTVSKHSLGNEILFKTSERLEH